MTGWRGVEYLSTDTPSPPGAAQRSELRDA